MKITFETSDIIKEVIDSLEPYFPSDYDFSKFDSQNIEHADKSPEWILKNRDFIKAWEMLCTLIYVDDKREVHSDVLHSVDMNFKILNKVYETIK